MFKYELPLSRDFGASSTHRLNKVSLTKNCLSLAWNLLFPAHREATTVISVSKEQFSLPCYIGNFLFCLEPHFDSLTIRSFSLCQFTFFNYLHIFFHNFIKPCHMLLKIKNTIPSPLQASVFSKAPFQSLSTQAYFKAFLFSLSVFWFYILQTTFYAFTAIFFNSCRTFHWVTAPQFSYTFPITKERLLSCSLMYPKQWGTAFSM